MGTRPPVPIQLAPETLPHHRPHPHPQIHIHHHKVVRGHLDEIIGDVGELFRDDDGVRQKLLGGSTLVRFGQPQRCTTDLTV